MAKAGTHAVTSQYAMVLEYLQRTGSITSIDAIWRFNITRLAAVISELRKTYEIETEMQVTTNKAGKKTRYAVYNYLGKKGEVNV